MGEVMRPTQGEGLPAFARLIIVNAKAFFFWPPVSESVLLGEFTLFLLPVQKQN